MNSWPDLTDSWQSPYRFHFIYKQPLSYKWSHEQSETKKPWIVKSTSVYTHIVLKPDHAFAALCHNFWLTRKGCAFFFLYSPPHQFFLYTPPHHHHHYPKPITPLLSPFSPWLCCPTDHTVTLSLAYKSLITRLIIFFSCSYSCCLHSQYQLKTDSLHMGIIFWFD